MRGINVDEKVAGTAVQSVIMKPALLAEDVIGDTLANHVKRRPAFSNDLRVTRTVFSCDFFALRPSEALRSAVWCRGDSLAVQT